MTEAQKKARMANLANGRKKRMEMLQKKKESPKGTEQEYDLSSDESMSDSSNDSSDNEAFVISKKKPKAKPVDKKQKYHGAKVKIAEVEKPMHDNLRHEVDELKSIMMELATMQKKQNKVTRKQSKKPAGSTKIVVLPQNNSGGSHSQANDSVMDALRKSLM